MAKTEDGCCERLNEFFYGLCVECGIVVLVMLDFLAITAELLIKLDVIQDPNDAGNSAFGSTEVTTVVNNSTVGNDFDPGGKICRKCASLSNPIGITFCVVHYFSVVISGVFFIEIVLRFLSGRSKLCKDYLQVFDSFVVVLLVTMEILFTVFWDEVLCKHVVVEAATYIVLLRLCRVPRACSVTKDVYAEKIDVEIHYLRKEKRRVDEHSTGLQETVNKQQREIETLRNHLKEMKENDKKSMTDTERRGSSEVCNGYVLDGTDKSSTELSLVSYSHADKGQFVRDSLHSKHSNNPSNKTTITETVNNNLAPPGVSVTVIQTTYQSVGDTKQRERNRSSSTSETEFTHIHTDSGNNKGNGSVDIQVSGGDSKIKSEKKSPTKNESEKKTKLQRSRSDSALSSESVTRIVIRQLDKAINEGNRPASGTGGFDNKSYQQDDDEDEKVQMRNLPVMAEYQGTRTYRSAEGVPLTDL